MSRSSTLSVGDPSSDAFAFAPLDHGFSARPEAGSSAHGRSMPPPAREAIATETPAQEAQWVELRQLYRQRVLKGATIIKTLANSEIGCQVRNQHERGAELKVAADTHIPAGFLLYVPTDGVAYRAEVRWRQGDRVGVEFAGVVPKPPHHYG